MTVKSLDEIKREKEQRLLGGSAHDHETTTGHVSSHDSLQAGGSAEDSGKDRNLFGKTPIDYRHLKSDFVTRKRVLLTFLNRRGRFPPSRALENLWRCTLLSLSAFLLISSSICFAYIAANVTIAAAKI